MFAILVQLVGQAIVDFKPASESSDEYAAIMRSNGEDGPRFIKPRRGHEDGCVDGICAESQAGQFAQPK